MQWRSKGHKLKGPYREEWAAPFKIHTPPVEDFEKVYPRGEYDIL